MCHLSNYKKQYAITFVCMVRKHPQKKNIQYSSHKYISNTPTQTPYIHFNNTPYLSIWGFHALTHATKTNRLQH